VGAGHNIRLLLAWLRALSYLFLALVASALSPPKSTGGVPRRAL
jgi:hypothetical protein